MILVDEPWYNEPGREGRVEKDNSLLYNDHIAQLTVRYAIMNWLSLVPRVKEQKKAAKNNKTTAIKAKLADNHNDMLYAPSESHGKITVPNTSSAIEDDYRASLDFYNQLTHKSAPHQELFGKEKDAKQAKISSQNPYAPLAHLAKGVSSKDKKQLNLWTDPKFLNGAGDQLSHAHPQAHASPLSGLPMANHPGHNMPAGAPSYEQYKYYKTVKGNGIGQPNSFGHQVSQQQPPPQSQQIPPFPEGFYGKPNTTTPEGSQPQEEQHWEPVVSKKSAKNGKPATSNPVPGGQTSPDTLPPTTTGPGHHDAASSEFATQVANVAKFFNHHNIPFPAEAFATLGPGGPTPAAAAMGGHPNPLAPFPPGGVPGVLTMGPAPPTNPLAAFSPLAAFPPAPPPGNPSVGTGFFPNPLNSHPMMMWGHAALPPGAYYSHGGNPLFQPQQNDAGTTNTTATAGGAPPPHHQPAFSSELMMGPTLGSMAGLGFSLGASEDSDPDAWVDEEEEYLPSSLAGLGNKKNSSSSTTPRVVGGNKAASNDEAIWGEVVRFHFAGRPGRRDEVFDVARHWATKTAPQPSGRISYEVHYTSKESWEGVMAELEGKLWV